MQIITKFHGPTDARDSRVSATFDRRYRVTLPWDYALHARDNHLAAAKAVAEKHKLDGEWIDGGESVDGTGRVYVRITTWADRFTIEKEV